MRVGRGAWNMEYGDGLLKTSYDSDKPDNPQPSLYSTTGSNMSQPEVGVLNLTQNRVEVVGCTFIGTFGGI